MTVIGALALRRAGGDDAQGGRAVRLPPGGTLAGGRVPLRLDPLRRDPDRHHRRGGGGVRAVPQRAGARRQPGRLSPAGPAAPARVRPTPFSWASRPSGSWRFSRFCCSPRSTFAASGSARRFRRCSAWPRSARSRCWCCSASPSSGGPRSRRPTSPTSGAPGTGALAMIPVLGAAMVGSLFSSDAWNNVTFAAGRGAEPEPEPAPGARPGHAHGEPALHPEPTSPTSTSCRSTATPTAPTRSPAGSSTPRRTGSAPPPSRWRSGSGAAAVMAVAILLSTFGCNNGLILSGPRVYWAMARDRLFFERRRSAAPGLPDPGVRTGGPGGLGFGALCQRHVRAAPGLRHFRGAALLFPHRCITLPAAPDPAGPAPAGQGVRLPGASGDSTCCSRRPDGDPAVPATPVHRRGLPHRRHRAFRSTSSGGGARSLPEGPGRALDFPGTPP